MKKNTDPPFVYICRHCDGMYGAFTGGNPPFTKDPYVCKVLVLEERIKWITCTSCTQNGFWRKWQDG